MLLWFLNLFREFSIAIFGVGVVVFIVISVIDVKYRIYIQLILVTFLIINAYMAGSNAETIKWEHKEALLKVQIEKLNTDRITLTNKANLQAAKNKQLIQENNRIKDINVYLSHQDIASCLIPPGFIRLHNDSARNKVSGTAGTADEKSGESKGSP